MENKWPNFHHNSSLDTYKPNWLKHSLMALFLGESISQSFITKYATKIVQRLINFSPVWSRKTKIGSLFLICFNIFFSSRLQSIFHKCLTFSLYISLFPFSDGSYFLLIFIAIFPYYCKIINSIQRGAKKKKEDMNIKNKEQIKQSKDILESKKIRNNSRKVRIQ